MDIVKTGNLIKELRTGKELTQKELAERINVSTAAVSKWENGKGFPDISILESLSFELGISITELVKGEKAPGVSEADSVAMEIIEISKKEIKFERTRQIFITAVFIASVLLVNIFIIFDAVSGYQNNLTFYVSTASLTGLFMFLSGGNAILFGLFNLFFGNKISIQKAMQISLFSEACCAASIWLATVYTNYKISVNDISAVIDTANFHEIYSRMIFLITILINIFAYWKIVRNK